MANHDSVYETAFHMNEQELMNLVEACHRTIDWSIGLYFKTVKKGIPLFAEKLAGNETLDFHDGFTTFFLNDIELAQLINDLEDHINHEIIVIQNKRLPAVTFSNLDIIPSFTFLSELIDEQKTTMKLSQQVEKTVCQLAAKTLLSLNPSFIPKPLLAKAAPSFGRTLTRALAVDAGSHRHHFKKTVEEQLIGLLENMEHTMKEQLKYQLAEQLYGWFDQTGAG